MKPICDVVRRGWLLLALHRRVSSKREEYSSFIILPCLNGVDSRTISEFPEMGGTSRLQAKVLEANAPE
jgi:hypothetical protein